MAIKQFWYSLLIALVGLTLSLPGLAQKEIAGKQLTLPEALDVALHHHPAITEYKERSLSAQAQIGISRANLLPQVSSTSSYYYGNSVPSSSLNIPSGFGPLGVGQGNISDFMVHSFQVNQLLFDFGKTLGQVGRSKALYDVSKMDLANIRQQVALDVKTAFFGYLAAERAVVVSEDNLRLNEDLVRQAQGFYQVGAKAKIDVTTAEANLYSAQSDLITARNNLQIAQISLMTAMGSEVLALSGIVLQA